MPPVCAKAQSADYKPGYNLVPSLVVCVRDYNKLNYILPSKAQKMNMIESHTSCTCILPLLAPLFFHIVASQLEGQPPPLPDSGKLLVITNTCTVHCRSKAISW